MINNLKFINNKLVRENPVQTYEIKNKIYNNNLKIKKWEKKLNSIK